MPDIKLDITALRNVIARLEKGLTRYHKDKTDDQLRDGLIQRFKFVYEISHKLLKRFLEATSANPAAFDEMTFQDLIRTANERGLLRGDWSKWKQYRDMRAKTSHTYAEEIAIDVAEGIPDFLAEACYLRNRLEHELNG